MYDEEVNYLKKILKDAIKRKNQVGQQIKHLEDFHDLFDETVGIINDSDNLGTVDGCYLESLDSLTDDRPLNEKTEVKREIFTVTQKVKKLLADGNDARISNDLMKKLNELMRQAVSSALDRESKFDVLIDVSDPLVGQSDHFKVKQNKVMKQDRMDTTFCCGFFSRLGSACCGNDEAGTPLMKENSPR